jgi:hypothetical protein
MDIHYSREQLALFMKYINPVALAADCTHTYRVRILYSIKQRAVRELTGHVIHPLRHG